MMVTEVTSVRYPDTPAPLTASTLASLYEQRSLDISTPREKKRNMSKSNLKRKPVWEWMLLQLREWKEETDNRLTILERMRAANRLAHLEARVIVAERLGRRLAKIEAIHEKAGRTSRAYSDMEDRVAFLEEALATVANVMATQQQQQKTTTSPTLCLNAETEDLPDQTQRRKSILRNPKILPPIKKVPESTNHPKSQQGKVRSKKTLPPLIDKVFSDSPTNSMPLPPPPNTSENSFSRLSASELPPIPSLVTQQQTPPMNAVLEIQKEMTKQMMDTVAQNARVDVKTKKKKQPKPKSTPKKTRNSKEISENKECGKSPENALQREIEEFLKSKSEYQSSSSEDNLCIPIDDTDKIALTEPVYHMEMDSHTTRYDVTNQEKIPSSLINDRHSPNRDRISLVSAKETGNSIRLSNATLESIASEEIFVLNCSETNSQENVVRERFISDKSTETSPIVEVVRTRKRDEREQNLARNIPESTQSNDSEFSNIFENESQSSSCNFASHSGNRNTTEESSTVNETRKKTGGRKAKTENGSNKSRGEFAKPSGDFNMKEKTKRYLLRNMQDSKKNGNKKEILQKNLSETSSNDTQWQSTTASLPSIRQEVRVLRNKRAKRLHLTMNLNVQKLVKRSGSRHKAIVGSGSKYSTEKNTTDQESEGRDSRGDPALVRAAYEGRVRGSADSVEALLEAGTRVDVRGRRMRTALHAAAARGHEEATRLLLRTGARVDSLDAYGERPLTLAVAGGHVGVVTALLQHGANPDVCDENGEPVLVVAAQKKYDAILQLLLEKGADPNNVSKPGPRSKKETKRSSSNRRRGATALSVSVDHENMAMVELLLKMGALPDIQNEEYETPLCIAVRLQNLPLVQILLENGASPYLKCLKGDMVLGSAVKTGNLSIVEVLLNYSVKDEKVVEPGRDVLWAALTSGNVELLWLLLSAAPRAISGDFGSKALRYSVEQDKPVVLQTLLHAGADINTVFLNEPKSTLLHVSAMLGHMECASILLDEGFDVNKEDERGCTALFSAVNNYQVDVVGMLVRAGATFTKEYVRRAVCTRQAKVLRTFLEWGAECDMEDKYPDTGQQSVLPVINTGTILLHAVSQGDLSCTEVLLEKGANVNVHDNQGYSALHYAVREDNGHLVKMLLRAGADPKAPVSSTGRAVNDRGKTPLDFVRSENVRKMLEEKINKR